MFYKFWNTITGFKYVNVVSIVALALSALLLIGAFYFPFIHSTFHIDLPDWIPDWFGLHSELRDWVVKKGKIPTGDQYLLGIIKSLFEDGSIFLGIVIFLFSVMFPVLKIVLFAIYISRSFKRHAITNDGLFRAIGFVSKWSMADVFIVAVIIVMFKAKGFNFTFSAETGIYCYALSAVLSSLVISYISHRSESHNKIRSP
jgi:Paraquat-inducible protein A